MAEPAITGRPTTTRRAFMTACGAAGLAAALAACGSDGDSGSEASKSSGAGEPGQTGGGGGMELAKTSDIPEGGGKVFKDHEVVVTQPKAGEFKAFSSVCPHMGKPLGDVSGGTINCPFHGSKFNVADGSVKHGPATKALTPAEIKVQGDTISMA